MCSSDLERWNQSFLTYGGTPEDRLGGLAGIGSSSWKEPPPGSDFSFAPGGQAPGPPGQGEISEDELTRSLGRAAVDVWRMRSRSGRDLRASRGEPPDDERDRLLPSGGAEAGSGGAPTVSLPHLDTSGAGLSRDFKPPGIFSMGDFREFKNILLSSWFNVLLVCIPFGILSHFLAWGDVPTFFLCLTGIVPLAFMLGTLTEDVALRCGDQMGGLLNATFGNAVEMIIAIVFLWKGRTHPELNFVVTASLLGSILSNLLLVLGCCFLLGGWFHPLQKFSAAATKATNSLMFLACIAVVLPTLPKVIPEAFLDKGDDPHIMDAIALRMSHVTALVLLLVYCAYLYFQLSSHAHLFSGECEGGDEEEQQGEPSVAGDAEEPSLSLVGAISAMALITFVVAICSEFIGDSIEAVSERAHMSKAFIGVIVLPIASNACEHITAVLVAMRNKMDLALAVAVGSSIQIAIFVIPFIVVVAWCIGSSFDMTFDPFSCTVLTLSVILTTFVTSDGRSHWLTGVMLIVTYFLIGVAYLLLPYDTTPDTAAAGP